MTMTEPTTYTSMEVADMVGISYRMIDHFIREGHITLSCDPTPGSGRRRYWTEDELNAMRLFAAKYHQMLEYQETFRNGRVWDRALAEAEAASAARS